MDVCMSTIVPCIDDNGIMKAPKCRTLGVLSTLNPDNHIPTL